MNKCNKLLKKALIFIFQLLINYDLKIDKKLKKDQGWTSKTSLKPVA